MFDLTKPVQTRDGRAATILKTDMRDRYYPIVAVIHAPEYDMVRTFTTNGVFYARNTEPCNDDLVNVPTTTLKYENIYSAEYSHETLAKAVKARVPGCIGTVELTLQDGKLIKAELIS